VGPERRIALERDAIDAALLGYFREKHTRRLVIGELGAVTRGGTESPEELDLARIVRDGSRGVGGAELRKRSRVSVGVLDTSGALDPILVDWVRWQGSSSLIQGNHLCARESRPEDAHALESADVREFLLGIPIVVCPQGKGCLL